LFYIIAIFLSPLLQILTW